MARKGSEFNGGAPAVGLDAGGRRTVTHVSSSGKLYVASGIDGLRDIVRTIDGMALQQFADPGNTAANARCDAMDAAGEFGA
jgi:hypothetical protein